MSCHSSLWFFSSWIFLARGRSQTLVIFAKKIITRVRIITQIYKILTIEINFSFHFDSFNRRPTSNFPDRDIFPWNDNHVFAPIWKNGCPRGRVSDGIYFHFMATQPPWCCHNYFWRRTSTLESPLPFVHCNCMLCK